MKVKNKTIIINYFRDIEFDDIPSSQEKTNFIKGIIRFVNDMGKHNLLNKSWVFYPVVGRSPICPASKWALWNKTPIQNNK